jgi:hypothetical protein
MGAFSQEGLHELVRYLLNLGEGIASFSHVYLLKIDFMDAMFRPPHEYTCLDELGFFIHKQRRWILEAMHIRSIIFHILSNQYIHAKLEKGSFRKMLTHLFHHLPKEEQERPWKMLIPVKGEETFEDTKRFGNTVNLLLLFAKLFRENDKMLKALQEKISTYNGKECAFLYQHFPEKYEELIKQYDECGMRVELTDYLLTVFKAFKMEHKKRKEIFHRFTEHFRYIPLGKIPYEEFVAKYPQLIKALNEIMWKRTIKKIYSQIQKTVKGTEEAQKIAWAYSMRPAVRYP